jgi:ferredoxin-nitrite reductase
MNAPDGFNEEQQAFLQGLILGTDVARKVRGLPVLSGSAAALGLEEGSTPQGMTVQIGGGQAKSSIHEVARQRFERLGKKLVAEEVAKRDKCGLGVWHEIAERSSNNEFPKGTDVFLTKFHGLFYVAPAQNAYMCRMRLPGGILRADQLEGVANLSDLHANSNVDITTRANLQLREIPADHGLDLLMGLRDLGIVTQGAGADNIRNVTASTLSGLDSMELIETIPLARKLHYHILHKPELHGLPRKFNIAFDGGGAISSLAETNDVCFHAVDLDLEGIDRGVHFLLGLGGITGHGDFARPTGVIVKPSECIRVAEAIVRVFIQHGDRTNRKKARLKYLLDDWGFPRFLETIERELGSPLVRVDHTLVDWIDRSDRWAHVDVHPQKQPGLSYVGVVLPAGRMTSQQCRTLADMARRFGSGELRLTVWQNLIIPNIPNERVPEVLALIGKTGLDWQTSSIRAGLVACTGKAGCKYAAADTKRHAMLLASELESRWPLDSPINIHLTGCHHSCAQHAIADIGLIATGVEVGDELREGYHILVGGKTGAQARLGTCVFESVVAEELVSRVSQLIGFYWEHRIGAETFEVFAQRIDWDSWKRQQKPHGPEAAA